MRLPTSFPLLFTTSGEVFCLKFGGVSEMLWIFKVARWTHERCMKINKCPTVSNGFVALSFEIWTATWAHLFTMGTLTNSWSLELETLQSWLPCRHPKTWQSDAKISDLENFFFFMLSFLSEKQQHLLDIQEHCICKLGRIWSELKLLSGVYYRFLKLYTGNNWQSYFPLHRIL